MHSLKFQSVVIPNGLIANLHGLFEGKRHDSTMLQETGLLNDFRRVAFYYGGHLCLYGDPAYPLGLHLQAPFRNMHLTPKMVLYNEAMSEVRVAVEWLFGNITNYFKFLILRASCELIWVQWENFILFVHFWRMLIHVFMVILFQKSLAFNHFPYGSISSNSKCPRVYVWTCVIFGDCIFACNLW